MIQTKIWRKKMNKEEAIQELQNQARHHCGEIECYKDRCEKSVELSKAMTIVSRIDELQKDKL